MGHPATSPPTAAGYQGDRCHETGRKGSGRPLFNIEVIPGTASRSDGPDIPPHRPVGFKTVGGRALRPGLLTSPPRRGMINA